MWNVIEIQFDWYTYSTLLRKMKNVRHDAAYIYHNGKLWLRFFDSFQMGLPLVDETFPQPYECPPRFLLISVTERRINGLTSTSSLLTRICFKRTNFWACFAVSTVTWGVKPVFIIGLFRTLTPSFSRSSLIICLVVPTGKPPRNTERLSSSSIFFIWIGSALFGWYGRTSTETPSIRILPISTSRCACLTELRQTWGVNPRKIFGEFSTLYPCLAILLRSAFSVMCSGNPPRKTFCWSSQKILGSWRKLHPRPRLQCPFKKCLHSRCLNVWSIPPG